MNNIGHNSGRVSTMRKMLTATIDNNVETTIVIYNKLSVSVSVCACVCLRVCKHVCVSVNMSVHDDVDNNGDL